MMTARSLLTTALLAGMLDAQATWIVDRFNRPGAHFTDLPQAAAAASSGDILFLRATTTQLADTYEGPTIQGKGLTILGEAGAGLPVQVTGEWIIQSVPADRSVVVANLNMLGMQVGLVTRLFRPTWSNNQGSIVLQNVTVIGAVHDSAIFPGFPGTLITDCNLVVFSRCNLDTADGRWRFLRSKLMLDGTTMWKNGGLASSGYVTRGMLGIEDGELRMAASTLLGQNASPNAPLVANEPLLLCGATRVHVAAGSRLEGGLSMSGQRAPSIFVNCHPENQPQVFFDATTQLIPGVSPFMTMIQTPQSGVRLQLSPGTVQIDQHTTPSAPTILLMSPLSGSPWNFVIGPVFLDPNNLWSDLAFAPATGVLSRTFNIPPTIPVGQWVGVQAFELTATNDLLASNASVVGIW